MPSDPAASSPLPRVSSLLQKRDLEAFGKALEMYRPLLRDLVRDLDDPRLAAKIDISDLVQQTFQDAISGFDQLRAERTPQFFVWIRTLLFNNVHAAKRRFLATQKRNIAVEFSISEDSALLKAIADPTVDPERDTITDELLQRLEIAVRSLPEAVQTVLKWRYEEGLTFKEIGERVNRSEDSVRMLVTRCQKNLRAQLFGGESDQIALG
ncbi:sigma-70 family RNA polymerase sigma factor [Pirellulaceae bacterium SH501]